MKRAFIVFLFCILSVISAFAAEARIIGIDIQSKWGASWKFPVLGLDNRGANGEGVKDYSNLQTMKDGDVLVVGTHSNPDVFGSGTELIKWSNFWSHFRVDNPPKLAAVIICGCMEDVTDADLENIRSVFNAGAVFSPRGTYGLPHLISTETIITGLKNGDSLDTIQRQVSATHFVKTDSGVQPNWTLAQLSVSRQSLQTNQNTYNSSGGNSYTANGRFILWINKFGDGGRIHAGSPDTYNAPKKYVDEWLAGTSTAYLEKQLLFEGRGFDTLAEAKAFMCTQITNRRYQNVLGWGRIQLGDFEGNSYLIDGLECTIP